MTPLLHAIVKAGVLLPGLYLLLLCSGLYLLPHRRLMAGMLLSLVILLLYLSATPLVARYLASLVEPVTALDLNAYPVEPGDAILVLGCNYYPHAPEYGHDDVSACSLVRLRYAAELHAQTGLPVLLSGGRRFAQHESEAEVMARVLEQRFGIVPVGMENNSRNTVENARYSRSLVADKGFSRIYLVTHAVHMPRAATLYRKAGHTVVPAPTYFYSAPDYRPLLLRILPCVDALLVTNLVWHELLGMAWQWLTVR